MCGWVSVFLIGMRGDGVMKGVYCVIWVIVLVCCGNVVVNCDIVVSW